MSENNKKHKKTNMIKVFILLFIIYLGVKALSSYFGGTSRVITVEKDNLIDSIDTEGVIIKQEDIFTAPNEGELETLVEEGERVPAGKKVATLVSSSGNTAIEEELNQLDKSINELKEAREDSEKLTQGGNIDDVIEDIKDNIQINIRDNNLEEVYILKERLSIIMDLDQGDEESKGDRIESLEKKRNELAEELTRNIKDYFTETGGIITFKIDGKEEEYKAENFKKYSYDKIKIDEEIEVKDMKDIKKIKVNEPMFKLIDNFKWYMGIKVDDAKTIQDIKDRKNLTIRVKDSDRDLTGSIVSINEHKNKAVIILEFTKDLHEYYDKRFLNLKLIKSDVTGFKVPKESIIKKGKQEGVLIKDSSGIVEFRPVIIIGEDDQNFYVKSGDENGNVHNEDDELLKTITIFDEIFLNPKSVKEGQIIN